ncbi:hypothetical protein ACJJTC_008724 [Scirpophaga incertulas]
MFRNKFTPIASFFRILVRYKIINNVIKSKRINFRDYNTKMLSVNIGVAFLWPVKTTNRETVKSKMDITHVLDSADKLFDSGHYEECYNLLTACQDENVEISWRVCRVLYNMSKDTKYDKAYKKELILRAFDIISTVLLEHNQHHAVHKWYALLLEAKSSYAGIKEKIQQLENIKKHMDLAVTLNPKDATILHMLGEWCYQVSELPWHQRKIAETLFASPPQSTYEDALEYFLRAEAVQPRFYSINLLRLGNCYLKLKKDDQAKYYLQLAASYPAKSNDDHRANKEAAELLNKIK